LLVDNPDLKLLNSARKPNRGVGLFLSLGSADEEDLGQRLVAPYELPHSYFTNVHTVIVISEKKSSKKRAVEFLRDQVRTLGEWRAEPQRLMLPALKQSYSQLGLHFIFARTGLGLEAREHRITSVLVAPTVADFSSLGLLESLLVSSVPTGFCSKRGTDKSGNPLYGVDYSKLLGG